MKSMFARLYIFARQIYVCAPNPKICANGNMLYKNEWSVVNGDLYGIGNKDDFFDIEEDL